MKIGFIGSGKMAEALIRSFLDSGTSVKDEIFASDKSGERLRSLSKELGINTAANNAEVVENSGAIFLSVKPQDMETVLKEISDVSKGKLFISIAAGITLSFIENYLKGAKVVRVMPNMNIMVGEGISCYSPGKKCGKDEEKSVANLLTVVGKAIKVDEKKLDAVTALSGSGPAFYAFVMDAFAKAGIEQGLNSEEAYLLAEQTALGTAKLLMDRKIGTKELIDAVASKGGTTEAGLRAMDQAALRREISRAVAAAKKRAGELSNG